MNTLIGCEKPAITDEEKAKDLMSLIGYWIKEDPDPEKIMNRLKKVWDNGYQCGVKKERTEIISSIKKRWEQPDNEK